MFSGKAVGIGGSRAIEPINQPPLISIIIPAHNAAGTIAETLATVVAQDWTAWEAIVVDDGSQDQTVATVQAWAAIEPRLRLARTGRSAAGPSAARNVGLGLARGNLIAFLDADDGWTADKLSAQVAALAANPQAALVYSWSDYVCDRVDDQARLLYPGFRQAIAGQVFGRLLANNFIENGSNPLVRRPALDHVAGPSGWFDETLRQAEDWDLWLRLAREFPIAVVPKVQVRYRVSAGSASAQIRDLERGCWAVLDRHRRLPPPPGLTAPELTAIVRQAKARILRGLACKALTAGPPGRDRGWRSLVLLGRSIAYQPRQLREIKFLLILSLKISLIILLGSDRADRIWQRSRRPSTEVVA